MKRIVFGQTHVINDDPNNINVDPKDMQEFLVDIQLSNQTSTDDARDHVTCKHILTQLRNNSISKYMRDYYQDSQCVLIDIMFNQIILKHYIKEYHNQISLKLSSCGNINYNVDRDSDDKHETTNIDTKDAIKNDINITDDISESYTVNDNSNNNKNKNGSSNEFECLLFNQENLVSFIFEYIGFRQLCRCSLVNFVWLFHCFNINSTRHLPLTCLLAFEHKRQRNTGPQWDCRLMVLCSCA